MEIFSFFQKFNWLDWVIIAALIVFILDGIQSGFVALATGFIAYLAAFWLAFRFHVPVGDFIVKRLGIDAKWTDLIGYGIIILFIQILISRLLIMLLHKPVRRFIPDKVDAILGGIFSLVNTLISITLLLLLAVALPLPISIKNTVRTSALSSVFFDYSNKYAKPLKDSIETTAREAAKFITITSDSREIKTLDINIQNNELTDDNQSETKLLEFVNVERVKKGIVQLSLDPELSTLARSYSRYMLERRFFSHYDPEGKSLQDRLVGTGVTYSQIAENLAFAPSVDIAHEGLMNSESHRKNILDPSFSRIGIGVVDAGSYGKMITEIFADQPYLFKHYP